ncbi:hypothetical protein [Desertimonas flava]|jgi:hypothetical protein|nr:hypothetical protein [Desertimonas flava]
MALGACCWAIIAAIAVWDPARRAALAVAWPVALVTGGAVALRLAILACR